jgi:thioredoxin-related protein
MEKEVFNDPKMSLWLQQRFIPVKIDIEKEQLPFGKKVSFTPTFFFIKDDKILKVIPGSWNIEDFKDLTKDIK